MKHCKCSEKRVGQQTRGMKLHGSVHLVYIKSLHGLNPTNRLQCSWFVVHHFQVFQSSFLSADSALIRSAKRWIDRARSSLKNNLLIFLYVYYKYIPNKKGCEITCDALCLVSSVLRNTNNFRVTFFKNTQDRYLEVFTAGSTKFRVVTLEVVYNSL